MKCLTTIFCAIFSLSALALDLRPGLWEIDMTLKQNGKVIDPMAELKAAMKDMPEEQKKQMMQAMEGSGMGPDNMTQCYTQEMIDKAQLDVHDEEEGCKSKVVEKTSSKIVTNFNCEDGSKGTATMKINNPKSYTGDMKMTDKEGTVSEMTYKAKHVSKDCGDVEPVGV